MTLVVHLGSVLKLMSDRNVDDQFFSKLEKYQGNQVIQNERKEIKMWQEARKIPYQNAIIISNIFLLKTGARTDYEMDCKQTWETNVKPSFQNTFCLSIN